MAKKQRFKKSEIKEKKKPTPAQIKIIVDSMRELYKYTKKIKKIDPCTNCIQNPKTPPMLSESLALYLLKEKKILPHLSGYEFYFGDKDSPDIIASKNKKIAIEVKGTADKVFQQFGEKDLNSKYLIWINFGHFFSNPTLDHIEIYVFTDIGKAKYKKYIKKSGKMNLPKKGKQVDKDKVLDRFGNDVSGMKKDDPPFNLTEWYEKHGV